MGSQSSHADVVVADVLLAGRLFAGDRLALSDGTAGRSYTELAERVGRIAGVLAEEGIGAGDRVLLLSPNGPMMLEVLLAAATVGAAIVPVNHRLIGPEVAYQLQDAGARLSVVHPEFRLLAADAGLLDQAHLLLDESLEQRLAAAVPYAGARPDPSSVLIQLYTSGTTGRPKGCLLSQSNWLAQTTSFAHAYDIHREDVTLIGMPLFHVAALSWAIATLLCGGIVVVPERLEVDDFWDVVAGNGVTIVAAPFGVRAALKHPAAATATHKLRMMVGAPTRRAAELLPGVEMVSGYGQTELCGQVTAIRGDEHRRHPDSIGRLYAGYAALIVDDQGEPVGTGETGELLVRGPSVTSGYWQLPDASEELLRDGWAHTGDLMRRDADGLLYFVDRVKDMIKTGGENVYSAEVELVLLAHPQVHEVAVLGVPDERWGQAVKAVYVSPSGVTAAELDAWCRERLAPYKRPRWYQPAATLPRNASNKVLKVQLRDEHDPEIALRPTAP